MWRPDALGTGMAAAGSKRPRSNAPSETESERASRLAPERPRIVPPQLLTVKLLDDQGNARLSGELRAGTALLFGRDPGIPATCSSGHPELRLPLHLQQLNLPVSGLKIGDPKMTKRHGIFWAREDGSCFLRALNNPDGICKNGIRVKCRDADYELVFPKGQPASDVGDWPLPEDVAGLTVNMNNDFRLTLELTPPIELLIFGCSPTVSELPEVGGEVNDVASTFQGGSAVLPLWGGTMRGLAEVLSKQRTKRFHFTGHANADDPSAPRGTIAGRTLGFTLPGGRLSTVPADQLAALLGKHAPSGGVGGELSLVFINGCESEPLGHQIITEGVQTVVCWRTKSADEAARLFAVRFFQVIAQGGTDLEAFNAAVDEVRGVQYGPTARWKLEVPPDPLPTPYYCPQAAGLPVLLTSDGAGGVRTTLPSAVP